MESPAWLGGKCLSKGVKPGITDKLAEQWRYIKGNVVSLSHIEWYYQRYHLK